MTRCLQSMLAITALALALALACPAAVSAQNTQLPTKDYRPLPYSGSLAEIYKEQMLKAKGIDAKELQDLLTEIAKNPKKYEDLVKNFQSGHPAANDSAQLEKLLKNDDGTIKNLQQLKEMEASLKKLKEAQANAGNATDAHGKPAGNPADGPKDDRPDPLAKSAKWFADKIGHSSLPEKYPAFGKFKDDVLAGKWGNDGKQGLPGTGFEDILERWFGKTPAGDSHSPVSLPPVGPLQLPGAGAVPEVPVAPLVPDLAGGLGSAAGGRSTAAAAGGSLAVVEMLLIVAVFIVVAALVWRFFGPTRRRAPEMALAALGPWPVDPARITTRQQLMQAFEYLALLLLGNQARSANHVHIAGNLSTTPEKGKAAEQLASLYEKARYDPARDELPAGDFRAASRGLLLLAGGRAPASGEG
jgi:hypothetical protein